MTPQQRNFLANLYDSHYWEVKQYIYHKVSDEELAKELTQDTFREAMEEIDHVMAHPKPIAWLMIVAQNKIHEHNRFTRQIANCFVSLEAGVPESFLAVEEHGYTRVENEGLSPLDIIRQVLTEDEFTLLKDIVFRKKTHLTVSKELGISVSTSEKRMAKIRKKLARYFPEHQKKKRF